MADRLADNKSRAYTEAGFFFLDAVQGAATEGTIARGEAAVAIALMTRDAYITAWLRFTIAWTPSTAATSPTPARSATT